VKFRVKTFLIVSTLLITFGSLGVWAYRGWTQQMATSLLAEKSAIVFYDYQLDANGNPTYQGYPKYVPRQLVLWLGDDYFAKVQSFDVYVDFPFSMKRLTALSSAKTIVLSRAFGSLDGIQNFSSLNELEITPAVLTDYGTRIQDFSFLRSLKELKRLRLRSGDRDSIKYLDKCLKLEEFSLLSDQTVSFDSYVQYWGYLETTLKGLNEEVLSTSALSNKPFLRSVRIHRNRIDNLKAFKDNQLLQTLDLVGVQDADISCLESSASLHTLALSISKIRNTDLLMTIPNLKRLSIRYCDISDIPQPLRLPEGLEELVLEGLSVEDFSRFRFPKSLKTVAIRAIPSVDLHCLKELNRLQNVHLIKIPNIKGTDILEKLPKLKKLHCGNILSDRDQEKLRKIKPGLEVSF